MNADSQPSKKKEEIRFVGELGHGMFGTVRLAETPTGEKRAVKIIQASSLKTPRARRNLKNEIAIMSKINHVNIVRLFGVKMRNEEYWLLLEYCGGGDLAEYIAQMQRLSEHQTLFFFRQILTALEFFAKHNMIHRDL